MSAAERMEVCVVGGGVIGLSVAYELANRGRRVCVLERSRIGGDAAAQVAAGMLAPVSEADLAHPELTRLSLASAAMYEEWVAGVEAASGLDAGYEPTGTLIVALHRDHLAEIEHLRAFQRDRGLVAETLTRAEIRDFEPALAPTVVGGVRVGDRQVNPRRLMPALAAAITHMGGVIREGSWVSSIEAHGDRHRVTFDGAGVEHQLDAEAVVLAAGAWSSNVDVPGLALPLRPVKGQILRLSGARLLRHVVRTPDVYLVPRVDGELVVGATMEEQGFARGNRAGAVLDLLTEAARVLPGIRELDLAECGVGFRPALRDHLPAIGVTTDAGVFVATGHFRDGVLLAPVTARLLARLVCDGSEDAMLAPFTPSRFAVAEVLR